MRLDLKRAVDFDRESIRARKLSLLALLSEELEYQKHQGLLYAPILLACGIALYFAMPSEPPIILGGFAVLLSFFMRVFCPPDWRFIGSALILVCAGFFTGQLKTNLVHTPILQVELSPVMVEGTVEEVEDKGEEGARFILSDIHIDDLAAEETPRKIRLSARQDYDVRVGQRIRALSGLNPPSGAVMPGDFDFRQYLYFKGIGAVGFIYKDIEVLERAPPGALTRRVEALRQTIALRVERTMHYPEAGVAMALMIGRKTAIAPGDQEAMRGAGLAHMLAISGLHLGLFSGALFFVLRLALACWPRAALRYPIKKYAAVAAMVGAFIYMLLAGASIPTQRAMLMTGIVFMAIILDRSPISLRLVAFAAFAVLLFFPEALFSASFHMSFAAVTALIAVYDALRPVWTRLHRQAGFMRRTGLYFLGVTLTTVVATIATAPFALLHFHQLAAYSLLGNILAMPLLAFIIMPSILLSLVLMPLHLEALPLMLTEFGVNSILQVAHWVADLPGALIYAGLWPGSAAVCIVLAALCAILMRGRLRLIGLLPLGLALIAFGAYSAPDVLVSPDGNLVAVRGDDGQSLYVSSRTSERFVRESWTEAFGLTDEQVHKWPKEGTEGPVICGETVCRIVMNDQVITYIRSESAIASECASAAVVIADFPLRRLCLQGGENKPEIIDLSRARAEGAHAIWIDKSGDIKVKSSAQASGLRPWSGQ